MYNLPFSPIQNIGKIRLKVGSSCTNRIANNFFALVNAQPSYTQNRAHDFLLFKYFLNNVHSAVFINNALSKTCRITAIKSERLLVRKNAVTFLFSILLEICVMSKLYNVKAVFVLQLVMCSPLRNLSLVKFL